MSKKELESPEILTEEAAGAAAEAEQEPMETAEAPAAKKDKKLQIHDLVELGKAKGKLTTQEIMDAMEDFDFDPDQMDKLYEQLESQNIEIIDDFETAAFAD